MSFCLQLAASTNLRFETGANAPSNFSISSQTSLRVGVWCACVTKAQHISINLSTIHDETEFDKYGAQNFRRQFDRQFDRHFFETLGTRPPLSQIYLLCVRSMFCLHALCHEVISVFRLLGSGFHLFIFLYLSQ